MKNLLLLGDSIRMGYDKAVEKHWKERQMFISPLKIVVLHLMFYDISTNIKRL